MVKRPHTKFLIVLLVLLGAVALLMLHPFKGAPILPFVQSPPRKAFMNTDWGMSRQEVEAALQSSLEPIQSSRQFYTPKEGIQDKTRYQALQQSNVSFLGRLANVIYVFFDNRLYSYHVFVKDRDMEKLDKEMKAYLVKEFGTGYLFVHEEEPLSMLWHGKFLIVNYWLLNDDMGLSPKYEAGFGVVNVLLEEKIGN